MHTKKPSQIFRNQEMYVLNKYVVTFRISYLLTILSETDENFNTFSR